MSLNERLIITLDGPAGAGKGTIGKLIAEKFNLTYFQSSIPYRNLAYYCHKLNIDINDKKAILNIILDYNLLNYDNPTNNEEIGLIAAKISTVKEIRNRINLILQKVILQNTRIIMEGRDIGTIVAPNAHIKVFITANCEVRAKRRYNQLLNEGKACIYSEILQNLMARDESDSSREIAPLKAANDALIIDSSDLQIEEVIKKIEQYALDKNIQLKLKE